MLIITIINLQFRCLYYQCKAQGRMEYGYWEWQSCSSLAVWKASCQLQWVDDSDIEGIIASLGPVGDQNICLSSVGTLKDVLSLLDTTQNSSCSHAVDVVTEMVMPGYPFAPGPKAQGIVAIKVLYKCMKRLYFLAERQINPLAKALRRSLKLSCVSGRTFYHK